MTYPTVSNTVDVQLNLSTRWTNKLDTEVRDQELYSEEKIDQVVTEIAKRLGITEAKALDVALGMFLYTLQNTPEPFSL